MSIFIYISLHMFANMSMGWIPRSIVAKLKGMHIWQGKRRFVDKSHVVLFPNGL
jgi:hypothetical protein